ncbi:hypothetical protein PanWU01x14_264230 [Parasponia andersonii]|uniref:Cruciferin n=1 Tax=Parasponia andersonii TaxID=3476 RepID=A0A2P5B7F8_PARAD|nr:hypothetical protein PanWU01x14_264230 [Parasponia andersonii]
MDCRVLVPGGDPWVRGQIVGGFSHESEHDLALMVSDFLENGSGGADSWCSSDSESTLSDLSHLAEKIPFCKHPLAQFEMETLSVVHSLILSITKTELHAVKPGLCNASCIRFTLVKLLRLSGYDAAVCLSKWQGTGKVPGGDHEYIDVIDHNHGGSSERLIVDIDFRSHFEIARAVDSYDRILNSLPVVYVGSLARLKQFLQVMAEAARFSLKQNSMPLPPWRSLDYLQAKWESSYRRQSYPDKQNARSANPFDHKQCRGHLKRLQALLQAENETERFLKPINIDNSSRMKPERHRRYLY